MTTKTIGGAYPTGYNLKPAYVALDIEASASIGGAGVDTVASHPSTINNLGGVYGTYDGISLNDGGVVINGSATNSTAMINCGSTFDVVDGFEAAVAVAKGAGTVINYGVIETVTFSQYDQSTYSVWLNAGGSVTNGAAANTSASISNGVRISNAAGTVANFGSVGSNNVAYYNADQVFVLYLGNGVVMTAGGAVTNGSSADTTASIYGHSCGVTISGERGTVTNFGLIRGSDDFGYHSNDGVGLSGGGTVTNGGVTDTKAEISGFYDGVYVSGRRGKVTNFGIITATARDRSDGVKLTKGGVITNGGVTDAGASITGGVGVFLGGPGTLTNFGTIGSTYGVVRETAIAFYAASDVLIEEGSGVLTGEVAGGGGALELAAAAGAGTLKGVGSRITGFSTIVVEAGAGWHFDDATTIASGVTLQTFSGIDEDGVVDNTLTNNGVIDAAAIVELSKSSALDNAAGGEFLLVGDVGVSPAARATGTDIVNAGLIEKTAGTGSSAIRTDVTNTGTLEVASGTLALYLGVDNAGLLEALAGTLTVEGAVTGAGVVGIAAGTADFASAFSQDVTFAVGSTGELELANSRAYTGTITGFSTTGKTTLDLRDIKFTAGITKATYSGTAASGVLTVTDGTHTASIKLSGNFTASTFTVSSDGHGGTTVVDPMAGANAAPAGAFIGAMAGFGASAASQVTIGRDDWRGPRLRLVSPGVRMA